MTLRDKQSAFAVAIARLILWTHERGYDMTLADGSIDPIRKVRKQDGTIIHGVRDLNHKENGLHYIRLALDLNLFVNDVWIFRGDHPAWAEVGAHWESMDDRARWGGKFRSGDSNHFSFEHDGHS